MFKNFFFFRFSCCFTFLESSVAMFWFYDQIGLIIKKLSSIQDLPFFMNIFPLIFGRQNGVEMNETGGFKEGVRRS